MAILFFYQTKKIQESLSLPNIKNLILVTLMGLFFTGSLVLYSSGMSHLPDDQKMLGWPTLMVLIILSSQVWGWVFGEFKAAKKIYRVASVLLLVISIALLSV
jgi:L-rhamnose-H+ transport protein